MITLSPVQLTFVTDRHLATFTTVHPGGRPHVVPVAFTWDQELGIARITTKVTSVKARAIERAQAEGSPLRAALCQFEGRRWLTLEGSVTLSRDAALIAEAVARYAERYRALGEQPERVVLYVEVDRVMGTVR